VFDALFVPEHVLAQLTDRAWLQAMLDVERALASTEAALGLIPASAAAAIVPACRAELYDCERIAIEGRRAGNPAEALVRAMRQRVEGEAAGFIHHGATSQDIVDSAAMLIAQRVLDLVLDDLDEVAATCATLARDHRDTLMAARTLLQQALPTSFGLKAAGWLVAVVEARPLLAASRGRLALQLGGAAGTLASLGDAGPAVVAGMARELGLVEPALPWHTARGRVVELGSALDVVCGSLAKIALDIVLLAQTEVGEVAEPRGDGRGGSSTLPHKRNPIGSTLALACARRVHACAGLLAASLPQEHERAIGAWHAEWDALSGALSSSAGAARSLRDVLEGLEVRPERMRENLDLTRGLIMAERVQQLLAARVGRELAAEIVAAAADRTAAGPRAFGDELGADTRMPLTGAELADALDPAGYLGSAGVFIDRALELYAASLRTT
jgi:3-carboxy-cis,cis-muconate cycloisomerase